MPVTAAKFLRNTGNRRYFCTKYRRFRVFFAPIHRYTRKISGKILTRVSMLRFLSSDQFKLVIDAVNFMLPLICWRLQARETLKDDLFPMEFLSLDLLIGFPSLVMAPRVNSS